MKKDLKNLAESNGLTLHSFSKNHYEFSAVLKDKIEDLFVYVSISNVRYNKNGWYNDVLICSMKHDKDYSGEIRQSCKWIEVGEKSNEIIRKMIQDKNICYQNNLINEEIEYN